MEELIYTNHGKVATFVGAKGAVGYTDENFAKADVRLQLHLRNENGETRKVNCSPRLSADIRAKKIGMGEVLSLDWSEDQNGIATIHYNSAEVKFIDMAVIKVRDYAPSTAPVNFEDLIAL